MKALIVTDAHNMRGKVVDMQFTDHSKLYSDGTDKLYTINDFVELEAIDHEQAKADRMVDYWTKVSTAIAQYKRSEAKNGQ